MAAKLSNAGVVVSYACGRRFVPDVVAKIPKTANIIVACQKGLRWVIISVLHIEHNLFDFLSISWDLLASFGSNDGCFYKEIWKQGMPKNYLEISHKGVVYPCALFFSQITGCL